MMKTVLMNNLIGGSDVEIVPDRAESENDSDLDAQITQIISNLELQDQEAFDHANSSNFQYRQYEGMHLRQLATVAKGEVRYAKYLR